MWSRGSLDNEVDPYYHISPVLSFAPLSPSRASLSHADLHGRTRYFLIFPRIHDSAMRLSRSLGLIQLMRLTSAQLLIIAYLDNHRKPSRARTG
ncbi:unnamed protein product [Protopolystoma xenopodis]|uniref:Uncharacterized protein n=1 Tax=Protopolystoma xenopodis TaxID=117903 RepID=A0A448XKJ1_9PLAT|nr:unnamed protein product [Protopolystoma xenopodis]